MAQPWFKPELNTLSWKSTVAHWTHFPFALRPGTDEAGSHTYGYNKGK